MEETLSPPQALYYRLMLVLHILRAAKPRVELQGQHLTALVAVTTDLLIIKLIILYHL